MSTQNERSIKAQVIWNSTNSNSVTPTMVGSLFYEINVEKLERDNSNAVYQTYDASYTKVVAINPTTKKMTLIDIPVIQNNIKRNLQSNNINYCGFAPFGSAESSAVWTVTKITVADNGTITKQTFTNVTWSSVPF